MLNIPPESDGIRIDRFLKDHFPEISRPEIIRALDNGQIRVNGRRIIKGERVTAGSSVELNEKLAAWSHPKLLPNSSIALTVVHQDADLVIFNKPAGIPVHPLYWDETNTLANGALARFPELATVGSPPKEAGFVHRLDTGTSGLVVAARTATAYDAMRQLFAGDGIEKIYLGLVWGRLDGTGVIEAPIASDGRGSPRVKVLSDPTAQVAGPARWAKTLFEVEASYLEVTLLRLTIVGAGQRHQLRAHLASIGHPIVGDSIYGSNQERLGLTTGRFFLHASKLSLCHPVTGKSLVCVGPLPHDLEQCLVAAGAV